jgi:hypothetical protein
LAIWSGRPWVCHPKRGWLIVAFALVLAGCGASAKPHHAAPPPQSQSDRMKAVVRAWTANLNAGNNAAEVRLFSLPALISMVAGPFGCWCLTRAEIFQFHVQLPCSGPIVSIKVRGRYATAVFRMGDRQLSKCDAPRGSLTAVRFTIVHGKITAWKQVWFKPPGGRRSERPGGHPSPAGRSVSTNTHMECGLSSVQGLVAPRCAGLVRRGERIGCRRRLCRDSYARVGSA